MGIQHLLQLRLAERKKRHLLQLPSEDEEPQTYQPQRGSQIPQAGYRTGSEFRTRQPVDVDEAHEDQPQRHFWQQRRVALQVAREQKEKRNEKVKDQNNDRNIAPLAVEARAVKTDLFGRIAGPDNQELREAEVRPQHHEGEQEFPEVMQVARLQDALEYRRAGEQHHHTDHQGHRRNQLAGNIQETVNRGGPMRRQRHHPIDGRERHGENVKNDAGSGQHFQAATQRAVFAIDILLARPAVEYPHQQQPHGEVNQRTYMKPAGR